MSKPAPTIRIGLRMAGAGLLSAALNYFLFANVTILTIAVICIAIGGVLVAVGMARRSCSTRRTERA